MDSIVAGVETVGNTVAFLVALLAKHPDAQTKLQAELDREMADGHLDPGSGDLKYLRACFQESQRLYPTACMIARILTKDTKVTGGYLLPKNTVVLCEQRIAALQETNFVR